MTVRSRIILGALWALSLVVAVQWSAKAQTILQRAAICDAPNPNNLKRACVSGLANRNAPNWVVAPGSDSTVTVSVTAKGMTVEIAGTSIVKAPALPLSGQVPVETIRFSYQDGQSTTAWDFKPAN